MRFEGLERRDLLAAMPQDVLDDALFSGHANVCNCPVCTGQGLAEIAGIGAAPAAAPGPVSALSSLPRLASNPEAAAKLYLDFDGYFQASWGSWSNITTPAFDVDGDPTTFSAGELGAIGEIWARIAEDYAPFNLDVTTIDPGAPADQSIAVIAIGGSSSDWYGPTAGGLSFVGGFYNSMSNVGFAFSSTLGGNTKSIAEAASHEAGHLFGLQHQSRWNGETLIEQYHSGAGSWAPIMGLGYQAPRTTWHNGTSPFGPAALQDDLSILAGSNNAFGWKADDVGNTPAAARAIGVAGNTVHVAGLIGSNDDQDVWTFHTVGGAVTLQLAGAALGTNLDAALELRSNSGQSLAVSDPSDSFGATLTQNLAAGDYYVVVRSSGGYGNLGQYTLGGTIPQGPFPEIGLRLGETELTDGQQLAFGTAVQGLPVERTFTVLNSGTSSLTLPPLNPTALPAGFAIAAGLGSTTLGSGESTTFSLRFTATAAGDFAGPWQIFSNDADESPFDLLLTGTVVAPDISVRLNGTALADAQTVDLGSTLSSNSVNYTFTVSNEGTYPLLLTPLDESALPAGFALVANLARTSLAPGQATTFTIQLLATASGVFSGPVQLRSSDPDESPFDLTLTALVAAPEIGVTLNGVNVQDGQAIDFGLAALGQPISRTFTVTNEGTAALSLPAINPASLPAGFSLTANLAISLVLPGQSTTFTLQLDAAAAGSFSGALALPSNDADENPFDLALTGRVAGQEITVLTGGVVVNDGAAIDFGTTPIHVPVLRTFTVRNDGLAALALVPLGANLPAGFSVAANLGQTSLLPGQSTSFTLRLQSASAGAYAASIQLASNDADESPFDLALTGRIVSPEITVRLNGNEVSAGGLVLFGVAGQGHPLDRTITIHNDGLAPLGIAPLNSASLPLGFSIAANVGTTSLAPGQSTSLTLRLTAEAAGTYGGTVALSSSDPDENPFALVLSGSVTAPEIEVTVEGTPIDDGGLVDFGQTRPGQPIVRNVTIFNRGDGTLSLAGINAASLPTGFTLVANLSTTSLAPGQATSLLVRLEAAASGEFGGAWAWASNDADESPFDLVLSGRVAAPEIGVQLGVTPLVDGQTIHFGTANQGAPIAREFTVVNQGTAALELVPLNPANLPAGFSLVLNLGRTRLEPGEFTTFTLLLNAAVEGVFGGSLSLESNDADEQPFDLVLDGRVTVPELAVEQAGANLLMGQSIDFGITQVGAPLERTFTIRNSGSGSLELSPLAAATIPPGYSVAADIGQTVLAPGQTTSFTLRLDAIIAGNSGGVVRLVSNDADESPFLIVLQGRVQAPDILLRHGAAVLFDGQFINFGAVQAGQPISRTFTVSNTGQTPLALAALDGSTLPAGFSVAANVGSLHLEPGEATSFTVQFDAPAAGTFGGLVQVLSNDPDENPFDLLVAASAIAPEIGVQGDGAELADGAVFDFGSTTNGKPALRSFTVLNAGTAALSLLPLSQATLPAGFSLVSDLGRTSLGPGESTSFSVQLDAAATGSFGGVLQLTSNDADENPFELVLAGSVSIPEISLSYDGVAIASGQPIDFGASLLGSGVSHVFTVENVGAAPLIVGPLGPADLPAGFSLVGPIAATSLAPGQTASFAIRLDAAALGSFGGMLELANNDADEGPFRLLLAGRVVAPKISVKMGGSELVQGEAIDFGASQQGLPVSRTLQITNSGTAPLELAAIAAADVPEGFSIGGDFSGALLAPGETTPIELRLDATAGGSFAGTLTIVSDDAGQSPFPVELRGMVRAPEITLLANGNEIVAEEAFDFGAMAVGGWRTRVITVRNDGDAALVLAPLDPTTLPGGFQLDSGPIVTTLAPGQATYFTLRLSSAVAGHYGGVWRLASNDADENPFALVLAGSIVQPEIAVALGNLELTSGQALGFGATVQGTPLVRTFTVTSAGGAPLALAPLDPATLPAGFSLVSNLDDVELAPGESASFSIQLNATVAGMFGGAIALVSNDADESPFRLLLSGQVVSVAETHVAIDLPAGGDYMLDRGGENLRVSRGGQTLFSRTSTTVASLLLRGTSSRETLNVSYAGGDPIPGGGVHFAAGAGGTPQDVLVVTGDGRQDLTWSRGNLVSGGGSAEIDGRTISYAGVSALDVSGQNRVSLRLPGGEHSLVIGDGLTRLNAAPALILQGTAAGNALPAIALAGNGTIAILADQPGSANDVVRLLKAVLPHGNTNVNISAGNDPGDRIEVVGAFETAGNLSFSGRDVLFVEPEGRVRGESVALVAGGGKIFDASLATPGVEAEVLDAAATAGIALGTRVGLVRARVDSLGDLEIQEFGTTTLADLATASGDIRVAAGGTIHAGSIVAAAGGQVTLVAEGAIVANSGNETVIRSHALHLQAGQNMGMPHEPLPVDAGVVSATSGGGVSMANAGDLELSASGAGDVSISTTGDLRLAGNVLANGNGSGLSLTAGGDFTLPQGITAAAAGPVHVEFGASGLSGESATALFDGNFYSDTSVSVSGGAGSDRFFAASALTFAAPAVTLQGNGGDDSFAVTPQVNASLSIRGHAFSSGPPPSDKDALDFDLSPSAIDGWRTAIVSATLSGGESGQAMTTGYGQVDYAGIDSLLVRDQGQPTGVGPGDLYVRGTDGNDIIEVGPRAAGGLALVRVNNLLLRLPVSGRTHLVGRGGNDALAQSGLGLPALMHGDEGDDSLTGDSADDVLLGGEGRDILLGQGGADYLAGEAGNDVLFGGADADRLYGGAGDDTLHGDDGDDLLAGSEGKDQLFGGAGSDVLIGGLGADLLSGQAGPDLLFAAKLSTASGQPDSMAPADRNDLAMAALLADWTANRRIDQPLSLPTDTDSDWISGGEGFDVAALNSEDDGNWDELLLP